VAPAASFALDGPPPTAPLCYSNIHVGRASKVPNGLPSDRRTGIVNIGAMGHNELMAQDHGWFSSTSDGDNSRLTDEQRQAIEERIRGRGQLLGVVQVRVFENDCEPFVTFPEGADLGVESDQAVIAEMVSRARTRLGDWR
jgi:hypothetical protein